MPNGYDLLFSAIIKTAINDYKRALKHNKRGQIRQLENFFLSDSGEVLSNNNGANIIKRVRKEIKNND